jgi:hypothetical protein
VLTAPAVPGDPELRFRWVVAIYLALSVVYFIPAFMPGRQVFGTDFLAGGFPFYSFISSRLAAGELPKWVPYVFGGLPMSANPGSTYYPVHMILDLLLPVDRVLASIFVFQFWVAGVGTYLLARELGCRRWVAFVTGLAFQFTGVVASWVYAGHDGRIIVATWAPMVWFLFHRGIRTGRVAPFAGVAAVLGMEFLSFQIQNSYYVLLSSAIWAVFCLVHLGVARRPAALARTVALGLGAVALAFALAAVDFVPFLSYVPQSPRAGPGGRGYEFSTSYSMPPVGIVAMAVPEHVGASVQDPETGQPVFPAYRVEGGFKLHTEYVGALVLVLLAVGVVVSRRRAYWWFFAGLSGFALTMALGGNTPLYRLYYAVLPGLKQFRAPDLIYFVIALSLVTMAGLTLERLAELRANARDRRGALTPDGVLLQRALWAGLAVAAVSLLGAVAAAGGGAPEGGARAAGWVRFALFAGVTGGLLTAWSREWLKPAALVWLLAGVTVIDLWIIDKRFFHTYPSAEVAFAPDDVVDFLRAQPGPARVWTFPVPQQYHSAGPYGGDYPMVFGIEQVGGEHPNPLKRFTEYVGAGQQSMIDWHNLLTEAGVVETPAGQAVGFRGVAGFLDAANVRYLVSMAPLSDPALREVHRGTAVIYENTRALPRAYLVPSVARVAPEGVLAAMQKGWDPRQTAYVADTAKVALPQGPLQGDARVTRHTPDRVEVRVRASRPALLVLADNYYPGWRARVDGRETPVYQANHTFRGVVVPAGEHTVAFTFEPGDLLKGLYISLAVAALLAGFGVYVLLGWLRRRREPASTSTS